MGEKQSQESLSPIAIFGGVILKFSMPILIACAIYLFVAQVGGSARNAMNLDMEKRTFYMNVFNFVLMIFKISSFATCLGFICKYFFETILGQSLTIFGAALYFGTTFFFVVV